MVDIKFIDEIIQLVEKYSSIEEIEIEKGEKGEDGYCKLIIKSKLPEQQILHQTLDKKIREVIICSPIVGTVHLKDPANKAYVKLGEEIDNHTTLCRIVAMALNHEISINGISSTQRDCINGDIYEKYKIKKILVENKQPIEYGERLFMLEPI